MFFKIGVLKNFEIFTGKHLRWNRPAILLKRDFSVPCEYCEILQNSFFIEHLPCLPMELVSIMGITQI